MLNIPLEAYFPTCMLPEHTQQDEHSHILPHQLEIMNFGLTEYQSAKCHLYCQGGVGSAKSVAYAARTVREMIEVQDNVGVVIRRDWDKLFKTSWLDIKKCIKKLIRLGYIPEPSYTKKRQGEYTEITFHNNAILYAAQGKNWTEALGASYGLTWCDDAMELPELLFVGDEVSAGLVSRLRLPEVRFYKDSQGNNVNRLINLVSSNPPPIGHFLHKIFGKEPGIFKLGEDVVKHMQVSSTVNPFTGSDYVKGLVAIQQTMTVHGRSNARQNIDRVVFGKSMPSYGGIPVYPQFDHKIHVGDFKYNPKYPLVAGVDFGVSHPAVVFGNLSKCAFGTNHLVTLSEVPDCFDLTIYELWDDFVQPHIDKLYKGVHITYAGDRAGFRKSANRKDKRSDMKILMVEYNLPFKHRYFDLIESIKYMRALLKPKSLCQCGLPNILISNKCPVLIGALEGGYRFSRNKNTAQVSDKPVKDKYFDDVADAWRYMGENFVKWGIPIDADTDLRAELQQIERRNHKPWDWMNGIGGMSEKDLAKLLTK